MSEKAIEQTQQLRSFGWKSNPSAPEIYSNYVHLGWTLDDVRMIFGSLKAEDVNTKQFFAEEKATVILGWRQIKLLNDNLTGLLAAHEAVNGPIETPILARPQKQAEEIAPTAEA